MTIIKRSTCYLPAILLLIVVGIAVTHPGYAAAQDATPLPTPVVATPAVEQGAPVVVNGETVFRVSDPAGYESVTARAEAISDNINRLASNPFVSEQPLTVIDAEDAAEVVAGNDVLFTVTDADAIAAGQSRLALAQDAAAIVQSTVAAGQAENTGLPLLTRIGILLAAIMVFAGLVWLINKVYAWLYGHFVPGNPHDWIPDQLTNTRLFRSGEFGRLVRGLLNVARYITIIFMFVLYVPFVLNQFPVTRGYADRILQPVNNGLARVWDGFFGFLPNLAFMAIVGLIAWVIIRLIKLLFIEVENGTIRLPRFAPEWADMTAALLSFLVGAVALIIILSTLPIGDSRALAGVLAFIGLLITLSSSSAIANIIAGVVLTYTNAIHNGDVVQVGSTTGMAVDRNILTTRIRTFKNEIVTIPNATMLSGTITNFSRLAEARQLIIHTAVTIGYDVKWAKVHELLLAAAADAKGFLTAPAPYILQQSLGDYSVAYELNVYSEKPEIMPLLYSQLHQNIQDQFNAAGIEILSPVYSAVRDGNKLTLPPEYLPQDYQATGFRRSDAGGKT